MSKIILLIFLFPVVIYANIDIDKFILGKSFFEKPWVSYPASTTARDGLGPLFNARSCIQCHPKNDRGTIKVITLDNLRTIYGHQIATLSNSGVLAEAKVKIINHKQIFIYPDGEKITLNKPKVILSNLGYGKINSTLTIRTPPKLFGVGMLDKISIKQVEKNLKNGGKLPKGKFGLTANNATLLIQIANAAFNDMGLTSYLYPQENCTKKQQKCLNSPKSPEFDLTRKRLEAIEYYLKNIKTPKNTTASKLFKDIGCAGCHTPKYKIGVKNITPYTDLLLHNLGDGYFRTAPLWGLKNQKLFMHDSRAKSVEEAILWHNFDAASVKSKFINLDKKQRKKLINFTKKL